MKPIIHSRASLIAAVVVGLVAASCVGEQEPVDELPVEPPTPALVPELVEGLQRWKVTDETVGPIRFGMLLAEAVAATGEEFKMDEDPLHVECVYGKAASMPPGMAIMFDHGVAARVDIDEEPHVRSEENIGVGSTLAEAKAAYGDRGEIVENRYEMMQLAVLRPDNAGGGFGAVFEASEDTIYTWWSGLLAQVQYSEGCS